MVDRDMARLSPGDDAAPANGADAGRDGGRADPAGHARGSAPDGGPRDHRDGAPDGGRGTASSHGRSGPGSATGVPAADAGSGDVVLEIDNAAKIFPGNIVALENASLRIRAGEVHCLLGANGAGKSTLLKIIAGAHLPSHGTLRLNGQPRRFRSPQEAALAGISMIYQELDLVPQLTVGQNMLLGRVPRRFGLIDRRRRREIAAAALARVGAGFGPDAVVESLSIANQQLAAIARSLTMDARLIIMDEPSAALNEVELRRVFGVIRELTRQGIAILYVSHRMAELREIGDRVTVLRNGRTVDTFALAATDERTLVEAVLGREQALVERSARPAAIGSVTLDVRRLEGGQGLSVRDLMLRQGEIVGLSGLNGSGRTSFLRSLFGDARWTGEVILNGQPFHPASPADAIRQGVALVPEDRKTQGLVLDASICRNAMLPSLRRRRLLTHDGLRRAARPVLADLSTRFHSLDQPVRQLSGGNQQKIVFAKWVLEGSRLLLLDEPSRGLDVGAKAELYALVRRLADDGAAILVASSELDEIFGRCDRIWVFHEGRNVRCFDPDRDTRDDILKAGLVGADHPEEPLA
ncbi:sugar ABC transporter ATP-binding protein [Rhizosaccharibacter radicis]|uniref:Sugar ABC transporter ATP-binding protein n=1 Tax=Rhizosaccharibacter radicis TaxID=2782605 RepID=A0ABT1VZR0_9PROT|nr:sugar ABC transporter ATP-binding protein [Acetobacteraceae bacterium KSS12]